MSLIQERICSKKGVMLHILQKHHKLNVCTRVNDMFVGINIKLVSDSSISRNCFDPDEKVSILVDMENILNVMPQFIGLSCRNSVMYSQNNKSVLIQLLGELFSHPLPEIKNTSMSHTIEPETNDFYLLLDALYGLNYSCIMCGEEYEQFPSKELYASHMRSAHAPLRSLGFALANPSLTG